MIIAIIVFLLISILTNIFLLNLNKNKKKKLEDKEIEIIQKNIAIDSAAKNLKALLDHDSIISDIRENHSDILKRIGKVKENDNEEINNILHDIINSNNKRVSDYRKNRDNQD